MAQAIRKVGVVGLGNMGLPIARTLAAAGFEVTGFDTMEERRAAFSPNLGSLGDLATASDALLLSLPTSDIIEKARASTALELESTRRKIKEEVVELTLKATERLIRERLDDARDRELVGSFINEMESRGE